MTFFVGLLASRFSAKQVVLCGLLISSLCTLLCPVAATHFGWLICLCLMIALEQVTAAKEAKYGALVLYYIVEPKMKKIPTTIFFKKS